ncbi:hypothetical protein FA95DRAFT_1455506, partial [Auriscalpium vulgare]
MPTHGDCNAPSFNQKAHKLLRYFDELNHLFARAQLVDNAPKKEHGSTRRGRSLRTLPKPIRNFRMPLLNCTRRQQGLQVYHQGHELVGSRYRLGIAFSGELSEFYQQVFAITDFLVKKSRISTRERDTVFLRAFQDSLMNQVATRLQIKLPDHNKETPYPMADVLEAGEYEL